MAYATGTPASLTDLIDDFKAFAIANGGFVDASADYTSAGILYTALQKGGIYTGLAYKDAVGGGDLFLNTATGWTAAATPALTAQAGACAKSAKTYLGLTPIQYWFFSDGDGTHMVVEISAGCYAHVSIGTLTKYGTYTGGDYVQANHWTNATWATNNARTMDGYLQASTNSFINHMRCTYAGKTIAGFGSNTHSGLNHVRNMWHGGGYYSGGANESELHKYQPNSYNGRAVLIPVEIFLAYDLTSTTDPTGWIPLGRVDNAAVVNMANLDPESLVNTDWVVFPLCMKNPTGSLTLASGQVNTGNMGIAYQK